MSLLFSPLSLRSVVLPNRVGIPPMCQYTAQDGLAGDWHFVHYGSRAVGGAAAGRWPGRRGGARGARWPRVDGAGSRETHGAAGCPGRASQRHSR